MFSHRMDTNGLPLPDRVALVCGTIRLWNTHRRWRFSHFSLHRLLCFASVLPDFGLLPYPFSWRSNLIWDVLHKIPRIPHPFCVLLFAYLLALHLHIGYILDSTHHALRSKEWIHQYFRVGRYAWIRSWYRYALEESPFPNINTILSLF